MSTATQLWIHGGGLALVLAGWLHYLALIPKEQVPARPVLHAGVMLLAGVGTLVAWGAGLSQGCGVTLWGWVLGGSVWGLAGFFLYLLTQAPLPERPIQVKVGQPMLPVVANDAQGQPHRSEDWRGQRILLKFFRGHW